MPDSLAPPRPHTDHAGRRDSQAPLPRAAPVVAATDLLHTFGAGHAKFTAVDVPEISIHRGELILLEGPSGSGKTTLISILGTLLRPERGRVAFGGTAVDWSDQRLLETLRSRTVGFVYQFFNLLEPLSARENVEVALNCGRVRGREARARARDALGRVGLGDRANDPVGVLSGGECQRVAIARALVNDPSLILADEPTANLDTENVERVGGILQALAGEGRALLLATHDARLCEFASRRIAMRDGRFVPGTSAD